MNVKSIIRKICPAPCRHAIWLVYAHLAAIPKGLGLIARDPASWRYTIPLIRSLGPEYDLLKAQTPWITFKAREWLDDYLTKDMTVFEYGSGGSTMFTVRRVGKIVSVEHDRGWSQRVSEMLRKNGLTNGELIVREPEPLNGTGSGAAYTSVKPEYAGMTFESYARSIDEFPDKSFDLVVIDGRTRVACIPHALPKIRPGGYLMFDDTERPEFAEAAPLLAKYPRTDFNGACPLLDYIKSTTVWQIN